MAENTALIDNIDIPGDGLLQTAIKGKKTHKENLANEGKSVSKPSPSPKSSLATYKPTASNPSTITELSPTESAKSLAKARVNQRAKVEAAKRAQEKRAR